MRLGGDHTTRYNVTLMTWANRRQLGATITLGLLCAPLIVFGGWLGARTNYFPALNDFWPLFFQANRLDPHDLETFKNGFFPPGYAVFLRLLSGEAVLARAFWANLLFTAATMVGSYGVVRLFATRPAALLAAALTAAHPVVFLLALTTGPDAGCIFFSASGFFLIVAGAQSTRPATKHALWLGAGVLLGLSALFRYHGLVFGVAAVASAVLIYRDRGLLIAACGPAGALLIFAALSMFPGISPQLARAQAFGVWEALHPINWNHMPTDFPPSIVGVIRAEPEAFWKVYWAFNRSMLWVLAAPALGAVLLPSAPRRAARAVLLLVVLYLPVVNMGTSVRGLGPILPIVIACTALLLDVLATQWLSGRVGRMVLATGTAAGLFYLGQLWVEANRTFVVGSIAGYEWRRAVELELRAQGVTSPLQVYGDAGFHFVTQAGPGWYTYIPHANGGWPRLDLYELDRVLPELATSSLDAFILDCERNGVTHVVLSGTAGYLLPELGEVYDGRRSDARLQPTSTVAGMRIFRVES